MRNIKKISLTLFLTFITACSGGGGGGSTTSPSTGGGGSPILGCMDPLANNYDSSATQDDGSCSYGSGGGGGQANASYYGYKLSSGAEITNRTDASLGADVMKIANKLAVDTTSINVGTNNVDVMVYQPSCLNPANADPIREYRLAMISSVGFTSTNPTLIKLRLDPAGTVRITPINQLGVMNPWNINLDLATPNDQTWTCNAGKYTLSGGAVLFSNTDAVVVKIGSDIYFGVSGTSLSDNSFIGISKVITYQENGGYNWRSPFSPYASENGELYIGLINEFYPNSGGPSNSLSVGYLGDIFSNNFSFKNDTGAYGFIAITNNGSNRYYGAISTIGGKKVGVFSGVQGFTNIDASTDKPTGSDSYSILIEQ